MESLELKPIFYVVFGIVITIIIAFVLWNKFAPDASRAFYNTVTGPGGLFGLALAGRKKGMSMSLLLLIIGSVIALTVIFLVMGGFIDQSGGVSSSLRDSLTDFGLGAASKIG